MSLSLSFNSKFYTLIESRLSGADYDGPLLASRIKGSSGYEAYVYLFTVRVEYGTTLNGDWSIFDAEFMAAPGTFSYISSPSPDGTLTRLYSGPNFFVFLALDGSSLPFIPSSTELRIFPLRSPPPPTFDPGAYEKLTLDALCPGNVSSLDNY